MLAIRILFTFRVSWTTATKVLLLLTLWATSHSPALAWAGEENPVLVQLRKRVEDGTGDRAMLRQELVVLMRQHGGTPTAIEAAKLLRRLSSPLDQLDAKQIPELERFDWQPRELVAVLGEHLGRQGHQATCVAYSGDGKRLVSGGQNGHVRLWDASTLRLLALVGTGHATLSVAISRDNKTMAASSSHGNVYVWDISKEDAAPRRRGHVHLASTAVYSIDISPDGKWLAAGVWDTATWLVNLNEDKPEMGPKLGGHTKPVRAVRFSPNNKTLATAGEDNTIRFWNITEKDPSELGKYEGHPAHILSLAYAPNGRVVAAGLADGNIWLWNSTGRSTQKQFYKAHKNGVVALDYTPGGTLLGSASPDGTVGLWDMRGRPREYARLDEHGLGVAGLAFSPDGRTLATASADWTVRVWNLVGRPSEKFPLKGHLARAASLDFTGDGQSLASGSEDRTARVWDVTKTSGTQTALFRGDSTPVYAVAFSPDGKELASGGASTTVHLWDAVRRSQLRTFPGHPTHVYDLDFTPDGSSLLASSGKTMLLWNAGSGRLLYNFPEHDQRINAMALSPDGRHAITGTGYYLYENGKIVIKDEKYVYTDCTLRLWDLQSGKLLKDATKLRYPVRDIVWHPGSSRVSCCLWEEKSRLWEVTAENIKEGEELKETSLWAHLQAFSPDGRILATVGRNHQLVLCDMETGKQTLKWSPQETIADLAFTPDSRHLAVGLQTGPIYILRLAPGPVSSSK